MWLIRIITVFSCSFPCSISILITVALNFYQVDDLSLFHYIFFLRYFYSCSLIWVIFLCFLILFYFLCLYKIKWNSYLPPSCGCVLFWEHPCVVCMCPVAVMGDLHQKWAWSASSSEVCSQHHLGGVRVRAGGARARVSCKPGFLLCLMAICTLMLSNCGAGEDSWGSLEQQGD